MHAGIIDQNLNRALFQNPIDGGASRGRIGQIELQCARLAACADDLCGDRFGRRDAAMSMHVDEMALCA